MLKHLPPNAVNILLETLNNIWFAGNFPPSWHTSTVIPIPKPAKDASDPNNYHPIALTSCLCKVMERMNNNRLVWFLERNKLITPLQCGFRKQRSTTDHLVRLESFIREAFTMAVLSMVLRENLTYVCWIRYRTMHCDYASVPIEPHLPQVCVFKPMNLHSTYGE